MKAISRRSAFMVIASILTIGVFLCIGIGTVILHGFIDFPCFAEYDAVNQCVMQPDYFSEPSNAQRIQVLLTTGYVGFSGGGCHAQESSEDRLTVDTSVLRLRFEREGNTLLLNGNELPEGEEFSFTKFWNLNPWTVYTIEFTNYGVVPICQRDVLPRVVVVGRYGNRVSVVKAVLMLVVLLSIIFGLSKRIKPRRTKVDS